MDTAEHTTVTGDWTGPVWDLLDEIPGIPADRIRAMSCGCMVRADGIWLDLYVWQNRRDACNMDRAHEMIFTTNVMADAVEGDPDEQPDAVTAAALLRLVEEYTQGWGERDLVLSRFPTI